ncbi:MAG: hypothetical protein LLF81_05470 [Porphyromonadaceae bacterium]|nr:hypothetical protein [Porphyromonadaceae bacterium]
MNREKLDELSNNIEKISSNFEEKSWTENFKLLRDDYDINNLETPKHYLNVLSELEEITRQVRLLFILSVLGKVCKEEGKLYNFNVPYQANMQYNGVFKKDSTFYLVDEDGNTRDVFTTEKFVQFIHIQYRKLYEGNTIV